MELLIVVLIIGVVYTVAVTNFQKVGDASKNIDLQNLKAYLQSIPHENDVKLLCLENCESCSVFADGEHLKELDEAFDGFLDESVELYRYEMITGMQEKQKEVYFNSENVEKEVCFSYRVDYRGVGEQVFVKFKERVYDYSTYLSPPLVYSSLADVVEAKEKLFDEVLR